jgi:hypothetical protein
MDRQLVLKKPPSAKMLPVGIIHPSGLHDLVTEIMAILKIMQRHHQPRNYRWRSVARVLRLPLLLVEHRGATFKAVLPPKPAAFYELKGPLSEAAFGFTLLRFHGVDTQPSPF